MNRVRLIDNNILGVVKAKNSLILDQFGDICYLLQRKWSGSVIPLTEVSGSQYTDVTKTQALIWEGNPGGTQAGDHPDIRFDVNNGIGYFTVEKDDVELTRISDLEDLSSDDEYTVTEDVDGSIYVNLYSSGSVVKVGYNTICYCVEPERSQGKTNCLSCYETMYEGGYDVYAGVETDWNPTNTILVRIPPAYSDVKVESVRNLREDEANEAWTIYDPTYPEIKDFDILIPLTGSHSGSAFEITNAKISHLRNNNLSQRFQIHNLFPTHVIYNYPLPAASGSYTLNDYLFAGDFHNS